MRRASKILLAFVGLSLIAGVSACSRKLAPETSCNFVQNSELQRVSWGEKTPVKLYIHQSVDPKYWPAIEAAVQTWNNEIPGRDLFKIEGTGVTGSGTPSRDGYSIIYMMNTWEADKPNEQARTTIYWTGSQIYEADIRINAHNFNFNYQSTSGTFYGVDLQSLVLHELGHVLGLAHAPSTGSVMAASLASGLERRDPAPSDINDLRCEY